MQTQPRLIPLTDWPKHHAWPPIGGLRHLAFNKSHNGFKAAFVKCGRRILVNESRFFECIARRQEFEELSHDAAAD